MKSTNLVDLFFKGIISLAMCRIIYKGRLVVYDTNGKSERIINLPHPNGIATGEIVVDGDDVDAATGERVQIYRQRCHKRFSFTCSHLGDITIMQNRAAHDLHIEMSLAERAF